MSLPESLLLLLLLYSKSHLEGRDLAEFCFSKHCNKPEYANI